MRKVKQSNVIKSNLVEQEEGDMVVTSLDN